MNYFGNLLVDFEVSLFRRDRLRNDWFFELTYLIWRNLRSDSISVTITWKTGVTSKIQSLHQIVHLKKLTSKTNHIEKFLIDFEFTHFSKWSISKWPFPKKTHWKWRLFPSDLLSKFRILKCTSKWYFLPSDNFRSDFNRYTHLWHFGATQIFALEKCP